MVEAAETQETKFSPKYEVEEIGPCKLKLRIEIDAGKVREQIDLKYRELNESVALPGFRKGHAPRNLLERKFGKAVLDDVKASLLQHSFEEVRDEKKLEPVSEPEIDLQELSLEEGKSFAYEFTLEVMPQVQVKAYEGLLVKKPPLQVDEKDVEAMLRAFQESKMELVPAEDQTARENDQIVADFTLLVEGREVAQAENNSVFLDGHIAFYGMRLPEFYKSILDRKVGQTVDFSLRLPEDFGDRTCAGKEAVLRTRLKSVKRKKLPEIDEAFARSLDMDSVDDLKGHIRKRVEREKDASIRAGMADELVERLVAENEFPMPAGLVAAGAEEALRRLHVNLAHQGVPEEEIHKRLEQGRNASREGMAKTLKAHFILEHIARKEKIFVTEDQVEERVAQMAALYGRWPHEMRAYLEERNLMSQLRRAMREELVREYLLSKAVIEETSVGS